MTATATLEAEATSFAEGTPLTERQTSPVLRYGIVAAMVVVLAVACELGFRTGSRKRDASEQFRSLMNGIGAAGFGGFQYFLDVEVAFGGGWRADGVGLVGEPHVQGSAVHLGVDRGGQNAIVLFPGGNRRIVFWAMIVLAVGTFLVFLPHTLIWGMRELFMKKGEMIAPRAAFGDALVELGGINSEVVVFDSDVKNAFVLPGGKVGFYKGLLDFSDNDDQVAAVLAAKELLPDNIMAAFNKALGKFICTE